MKVIFTAVWIIALAVPAYADHTPAERACLTFIDHVAARLRAGDSEQARRAVPRLRRCETLLKVALERQAKEIVQEHNAMRARSSQPPSRPGDRI